MDPILLPNSESSIKIKKGSAISSVFVELIFRKMNWATVSGRGHLAERSVKSILLVIFRKNSLIL